jgi:hypothetical protein
VFSQPLLDFFRAAGCNIINFILPFCHVRVNEGLARSEHGGAEPQTADRPVTTPPSKVPMEQALPINHE